MAMSQTDIERIECAKFVRQLPPGTVITDRGHLVTATGIVIGCLHNPKAVPTPVGKSEQEIQDALLEIKHGETLQDITSGLACLAIAGGLIAVLIKAPHIFAAFF